MSFLFSRLHRMIFWEMLRVFLLSLAGLTGLFLIVGVAQQASQLGLGPGKIFAIVPLLIPSSLPYTIPTTILFASCVAYGRLANDNEVVAMKAAGVDLLTILRPAFLMGLLGAGAVAGISYSLIPQTQVWLQDEILRDPEEFLYNQLKRERNLRYATSPFSLYVRDVQGDRLLDVVIKRKSAIRQVAGLGARVEYDFVGRTREATLKVDTERRKLVIDARRMVIANSDKSNATWVESADQAPIEIDLPDIFTKQPNTRPIAMDWDRLPARSAELAEKRTAKLAERAANAAAAESAADDKARGTILAQDAHFAQQLKDMDRDARNVEYEYHVRPALAVSCLVFAMIGCPVGVWFNRSDYLSTFVVCFIPTVTLYYPLLLSGGNVAKDGKLPMAVGVWAANAIVGLVAALLTARLLKR